MAKRILLINPNTTAAITDRLVSAAGKIAPDIEFVGATGRFGARYIASRATYAIASHAALDAWANAEGHFDAIVLACFGDPGLDALRELSSKPVVGMADGSLHVAMQVAKRFSIVTGGERWQSMLRDFVTREGLGPHLASIRTIAPTGGAIASAPEAALPLLREACTLCIEQDEADAVILGGAGLVGISAQMQPYFDVPVIDGLEAAVKTAVSMLVPAAQAAGAVALPDAVECVGLSASLTDVLEHKRTRADSTAT